MKKLTALILTLTLALCLTACGKNQGYTEGKAHLPLKGYYSYDNGILVETDPKTDFTYNVITDPKNAYVCTDGTLKKLKAFEITAAFPAEATGRTEIEIPIKYFVYNNTVYPYSKYDPVKLGGKFINFSPLPNSPDKFLVHGQTTMVYNIKTKECKPLLELKDGYMVHFQPTGKQNTSPDGRYVLADSPNPDMEGYHIYDLTDERYIKIPKPEYNKEEFDTLIVRPLSFIDNNLIFEGISCKYDDEKKQSKMYSYDIKNNKLKMLIDNIKTNSYTANSFYPNLLVTTDITKGSFSVYNIKTDKLYTYSSGKSAIIGGVPNESGEYAYISYREAPLAGYDENGVPYYENTTDYEKKLIDLKNNKELDFDSLIKEYSDKYGCEPFRVIWLSENTVLLQYAKGSGEDTEYFCEIAKLKLK